MRILQVSPEYPPNNLGGGGILVENLTRGLVQKNFEVTVISGYYPVEGFFDRPYSQLLKKINIAWIPLLPTPKTGFQLKTIMPPNLLAFLKLLQIFIRGNFDVVHIHGFGHFFCDIVSILCRATHKQYVLTIHGFPKEPERRGGILEAIYRIYTKTMGRQLITHAVQNVVVSRSLLFELTKFFPENRKKTQIIHNTINLEAYFPIGSFKSKKLLEKYDLIEKKIILCIGRLSANKGFQNAIRALPIVIKRVPNAHLGIIGKDEGYNYLNELRRIIQQEKMEAHVTFFGGINDEEKQKLLWSANLVLIPSIEEAFGLVALEAMAAGKPIIATKVGGLQEVLSSDDFSLLIDRENMTQLEDALIKGLCNENLVTLAKSNISERVCSFHLDSMVKKYVKIYKKITN